MWRRISIVLKLPSNKCKVFMVHCMSFSYLFLWILCCKFIKENCERFKNFDTNVTPLRDCHIVFFCYCHPSVKERPAWAESHDLISTQLIQNLYIFVILVDIWLTFGALIGHWQWQNRLLGLNADSGPNLQLASLSYMIWSNVLIHAQAIASRSCHVNCRSYFISTIPVNSFGL